MHECARGRFVAVNHDDARKRELHEEFFACSQLAKKRNVLICTYRVLTMRRQFR